MDERSRHRVIFKNQIMDNMDINGTNSSPENRFSIKTIETKLKNILYSVNFCGICFETGKDLCSLNAVFECSRKPQVKLLKDALDYLFYDTANVPASEYLCKKCTGTIINAYTFIRNAKETAKLINNYVNDFVSKTVDLNNQLEPNDNYENSNVIIVLENHEETSEIPIEFKVEEETKLKNEVQHKNDVLAQELGKNILKRAPSKSNELPNKKPKIEMKRVTAKPIREKEIEKKVSVKVPIVKIKLPRRKAYECTKCKVVFTKFNLWKEHEKDFHNKAIECKICSKTFDSLRILTEHYKLHNKLKCRICNNFVLDTDLTEHLRLNHANETHSCEYCDKTYYTAPALIAHTKIAHFNVKSVGDNDENPQCLMCLQYFKKEALKNHKCRDKCPDCTEIPCIHYKYLIHFKEQVLNHMNKIKCLDCDYICRRKDSLIGHVNREHIDYHPFTCNECGTQFFSKYRLKCHITVFHKENLNCAYCDKIFNNKTLYTRHLALCKIEKREFQCDICSASFITADELYNHDKMKHSDKNLPCDMCNKVFVKEKSLREHKLRTHRSVQLRKQMKWECLLCDQDNKFDTKREYRQHMESHDSNIKYICRICKTECKDLHSLQRHNRSHKNEDKKAEKCTICGKVVMSLHTHMFRHRAIMSDAFQCICDVCGKPFKCKTKLRVHRMIHLERVPCKVCSKPIKPSAMYSHMRIHNAFQCICDICGKSYKWETQLRRHKKIHLERVPCEVCSKPVKPSTMPNHMRIHKGRKRTFVCIYCDYMPQSLQSLEAHVNRYHLNKKPYVCDICENSFCTKNALKLHRSVHFNEKKFTCELCSNKFRHKKSLKKHMLLHTGEKPHVCDVCGEQFTCLSSLKEHKLKHGGKRIGCPLCESMFYSVKVMRLHFKKNHWKDKKKKFNPKEILDEKFHYLFEDRRRANFDLYDSS